MVRVSFRGGALTSPWKLAAPLKSSHQPCIHAIHVHIKIWMMKVSIAAVLLVFNPCRSFALCAVWDTSPIQHLTIKRRGTSGCHCMTGFSPTGSQKPPETVSEVKMWMLKNFPGGAYPQTNQVNEHYIHVILHRWKNTKSLTIVFTPL